MRAGASRLSLIQLSSFDCACCGGGSAGFGSCVVHCPAAAVINLTNDQVLKSAIDYCTANPNATIAAAAGQWTTQLPKQAEPPPQQAQSKDDNWIRLNLEAPARKALLDRR